MFDSDNRIRTSAATPGRDAKTLDRRRTKAETTDGRAVHCCPAHRWVEARRATRSARPPRLPAFVAS